MQNTKHTIKKLPAGVYQRAGNKPPRPKDDIKTIPKGYELAPDLPPELEIFIPIQKPTKRKK
jgi:hypothetical protein